jgi:hypothetical protein
MISQKYPMIAAAVAATLAVAGVANATPPSLSQAASPAASLVIAGSSAAESSVQAAVGTAICGSATNMLTVQSTGGSGNFFAFSCVPTATITGVPANGVVTIYYRTEGGSVVGALPVFSQKQIKRLNLSDGSCSAVATSGTCAITGVTATAGTQDSWTGAVIPALVQLGVTDVEPSQLTGLDYPTNYSVSAFGSATPAQLKSLPTSRIFQQIFGLVVNTSGGGFPAQINLTKQGAANVINGNYFDWNSVPDANGQPVNSSSQSITRIDREQGSGTRTATNIFFLNYGCGATTAIDSTGETLNFSTTDELTAASATPGAVAYTSIDQILKNASTWPKLQLVQIDGVTPSTLTAASGAYQYWFEATFVPNTTALGTGASSAIATILENTLPTLAGAPGTPDVNVIPNYKGNVAAIGPMTSKGTGSGQIYINPYTRLGNSCSVPTETN